MKYARTIAGAFLALSLSACGTPAPNSTSSLLPQSGSSLPWSWWRGPLDTGVAPSAKITASNVSNLRLAWKADLGSKGYGTPVVSGNIIVASATNSIAAFDAISGKQLWSFSSPQKYVLFSGPAIAGNEVVASTAWGGAATYALDIASGKLLWQRDWGTSFSSYGGALPTGAGTVVIGLANQTEPPCSHGEIVALDAATGATRWQHDTAADGDGSGTWSAANLSLTGDVLVTTGNACGTPGPADEPDSVLSLNAQTGVETWRFFASDSQNDPANTDLDFGSTPVDANGLIVAASKSGRVYGVGDISGTQVFDTRIAAASCCPSNGGSISSPAWDGRQLYVGGGSLAGDGTGHLVAMDLGGNVKWDFSSSAPVVSPPSVANDLVFVGSASDLVAIATSTGQQLWNYHTGGTIWAGAAISGKTVLTESNDGFLYAFSLP